MLQNNQAQFILCSVAIKKDISSHLTLYGPDMPTQGSNYAHFQASLAKTDRFRFKNHYFFFQKFLPETRNVHKNFCKLFDLVAS